jgi:ABC-2 type transport system permease protein
MMNIEQLWKKRAAHFWVECLRYSRYIGNSGTVTFLVFAFIVGAYYYGQMLHRLPTSYPVEWGIAVLFSLLLTVSPVRTFLREADLVFLLPVEWRMHRYFRSSIAYSFLLQGLYIFIVLLAVWPLYTHRMGGKAEGFLYVLLFLLVVKLANVIGSWQEQRLRERSARSIHAFIRWIANLAVALVLFSQGFQPWLLAALLTFLVAAFFYYRMLARNYLNWEHLVQREKEALARFYSFVNQFVDVPHMQNRVRRRALFANVVNRLAFTRENAYRYLYGKTFVRSDLFGMFLRLSVVGLLIIWSIPGDTGKTIAYAIVLYLTGIQLSALRQHHRYVFWNHIYPVPAGWREDAIVRLIFLLMLIQAAILYLAVLLSLSPGWAMALAPVLGVAVAYVYSHKVLKRRMLHAKL